MLGLRRENPLKSVVQQSWNSALDESAPEFNNPNAEQEKPETWNVYEWAKHRRRIDGKPFTLDNHKPLKAIYEDNHPYMVLIKPAQVGISEWGVNTAIHALEVGAQFWKTGKDGLNVGYLFPTRDALSDFSRERITSISEETEALERLFGDAQFDQVLFKKVRKSFLYLRGAWGKKALRSFAADVLILDEYDEMDNQAIELADKRLRASVVRRKIAISTPTLPGRGIHGLFLQSDQQIWHVPCDHCKALVELDFFRDVWANGEHTYEVWEHWHPEQIHAAEWDTFCPHCKHRINRFGDGQWIPRFPEIKGIRGYHVPSLCFPVFQLVPIILALTSNDPMRISEAYRSDLGIPYEPSGSRVTDQMITNLSIDLEHQKLPKNMVYKRVTMGVDVGNRLHYRISGERTDNGQRVVLDAGYVTEWEELSHLMREHKVRRCVVDAHPEIHKSKEWQQQHRGKVYRAYYPNMKGDLYLEKQEKYEVNINRTMAMDRVYAEIAEGTVAWPAILHNDLEIQKHLKAPIRTQVFDEYGNPKIQWIHTDPDHIFHASVYDMIAEKLLPVTKFGSVLVQSRVKDRFARGNGRGS